MAENRIRIFLDFCVKIEDALKYYEDEEQERTIYPPPFKKD